MSEAMEKWPVSMMKELLPRIYMIIEEINRRYVEELNNKGYDQDRIKRMSIIDCDNINMANLCIVTSHSVNGVAKLHTHILETEVLKISIKMNQINLIIRLMELHIGDGL